MQLYVSQADWGDAQPNDIEKLLKDTASHLNRLLRNPFDGLIYIKSFPPNEDPLTAYRRSPEDPFCVYLSVRDCYWTQFAYQFSHEFCHVLSGYESLKDNPNNWFHESICELASVFTLRRMAERWPTNPPYSHWANYAQALKKYSQKRLWRPEVQLPKDLTLQDWLSSHEDTLRKCKYEREKNALVAYALLPIFEHCPPGWNAIRNLPTSLGCLEEYLADWHSSADTADKSFVVSLSQAFGYSIDT